MTKTSKEVHDLDFSIEDKDFKAKVEFEMSYDPNYGADADGNRGMSRWDVTDAQVIDIYNITDKKYVDEKDLTHLQSKALESAIEEFDNFNEGRISSVDIKKKLEEASRILNENVSMRSFIESDWYGWAGATRFRNGAEPMIGEINNIDGDPDLGAVVVWDNEVVSINLVDTKDRPETRGDESYIYEYKDAADAQSKLNALKDGMTTDEIVKLGFERIN